jgi:hypothetical protein
VHKWGMSQGDLSPSHEKQFYCSIRLQAR